MSGELREIELEQLVVSKYNVRRRVDTEEIERLAEDIRQNGLHEPLVVRKENGKYGVVIGGRRLRAIRLIKERWPSDYQRLFPRGVPCIVRDLSPKDALLVSLSENYHKRSLSPDEYGAAIERLRELGVTEEEIQQRIRMRAEEIARALELWRAVKELEAKDVRVETARPGRPPEKRERPKRVTQKALVTARAVARRLKRRGLVRQPEEFVRTFVETVAEQGLSSKEIERVAEKLKAEALRAKSESQVYDVLKRAVEEVKKVETVERVVLLRKDVADAVSMFARKRGIKFDDAVNELLATELKRRGMLK